MKLKKKSKLYPQTRKQKEIIKVEINEIEKTKI